MRKTAIVLLAFLAVSFLAIVYAQSNLPAFPEAQGGGAAARGGRGGQVIEVTNLNDSGSGSLRNCMESSGARTCIFRVWGIINVQGDLRVGNGSLTIAGQSAPSGGIKLIGTGAMMWINTDNVQVRYLTYDGNSANNGPGAGSVSFDAGSGGNTHDVIFDHVSGFHVTNKQLIVLRNNTGPVSNVSFQWSMTFQPDAAHPVGPMVDATTGPAIDVNNIDYHHNFFGDTSHRLPLYNGHIGRWVSNIIYNWDQFATLVQGGAQFDAIANHYVSGLGLGHGGSCNPHEIEGDLAQSQDDTSASMPGPPSFYLSGNTGPNGTDWAMTAEVRSEGGCEAGFPSPVENSWRRSSPLPTEPFPITPDAATSLDTVLLSLVGNSRGLDCHGNWVARRQTEDAEMINEYVNGLTGSLWTAPGGYVTAAVPSNSSIPTCTESLHDGMPDQYKTDNGLSTTDTGLAQRAAPNGYTWLENYLNGKTGSSTITPPPASGTPLPPTGVTATPH
jgi:hypothetical protein